MAHNSFMPLWVGDYLRDTAHLSTVEHGAYLLLIMHYWSTGEPLRDDDDEMANIARMPVSDWLKIAPRIRRFFSKSSCLSYSPAIADALHHKRVDFELGASRERSESARRRGAIGAKARWQGAGEGKSDT
jgi:uncharacterized protein YdaU (DUF1376 family)